MPSNARELRSDRLNRITGPPDGLRPVPTPRPSPCRCLLAAGRTCGPRGRTTETNPCESLDTQAVQTHATMSHSPAPTPQFRAIPLEHTVNLTDIRTTPGAGAIDFGTHRCKAQLAKTSPASFDLAATRDCMLGVSLGTHNIGGARLEAVLEWISAHFDRCAVVVGDCVYRLALELLSGLPPEQALAEALEAGRAFEQSYAPPVPPIRPEVPVRMAADVARPGQQRILVGTGTRDRLCVACRPRPGPVASRPLAAVRDAAPALSRRRNAASPHGENGALERGTDLDVALHQKCW